MLQQHFFFIKTGSKYCKVRYSDILYAEGCKNYVRLVTAKKTHIIPVTMKRITDTLPETLFCRIHKSYVVSLDHIVAFDSERVHFTDMMLPVGKHYKHVLQNNVTIMVPEKRRAPVLNKLLPAYV